MLLYGATEGVDDKPECLILSTPRVLPLSTLEPLHHPPGISGQAVG